MSRSWVAVLLLVAVAVGTDSRNIARSEERGRITARVLRVIDGDTLEVKIADKSEKIRLAEIDAPETRQPWGGEATAALREWVGDQTVELRVIDVDRYGRLVCSVDFEGANINRGMVRMGHAWAYTRYVKDLTVIALEKDARAAARGLWSLPEAEREAPWEWRRAAKERRKASAGIPRARPPVDPRCSKRSCKEMTSCDEARFHLEYCGLGRLDGDGDGVPCESLCRSKR